MTNKPFAITLDPKSSLNNETGSWRNSRPVYTHKIPPCNMSCPAGHNVQEWLTKVQEGDIETAWHIIIRNNPFPAIMGRVCYHPCELACNRGRYDTPVNINLIEKYIGDTAIKEGWKFPKITESSGKKILIIGSGPAGLTAAYFLKKSGHDITILESMKKPGGMLRYGIPSYRLSREILDYEINRVLELGIGLKLNTPLKGLKSHLKEYDAVFLATGAHVASKLNLDICNGNIYDAVDLLKQMEDFGTQSVNLGENVIVYGGGNTAIDVARSAVRLGCKSVKIIYRRTLEKMPAHRNEIEEALAEGIEILCLRSITAIDNGYVTAEHVNLENDIYTPSGKFEKIKMDSVVFAIGQSIDTGIFDDIPEINVSDKGVIEVDDQMMTGMTGVFAGGDVVPSKRTVTTAIGHGKKAAYCIDAFLRNEKYIKNGAKDVITVNRMNLNYYEHSTGIKRDLQTGNDFKEHGVNLSYEEAISESMRCMSCGNCMSCDNCYAMCPDGAIKKDEFGLYIDYEYCKGCGICARECPCGCIKMEAEEK